MLNSGEKENEKLEKMEMRLGHDVCEIVEKLIVSTEDALSSLKLENDLNEAENGDKRKSILKQGPNITEKHVDFVEDAHIIREYDSTKDFTIDIQIVEKMPPKIVSYKALYAQRKAESEAAEKKSKEAIET